MNKTRERAILVGVLGLAGVGLLFDRVVLSSGVTGPSESSAGVLSPAPELLLITPDASAPDQPANTVQTPASQLAERLRAVRASEAVSDFDSGRDAFVPDKHWGGKQQAVQAPIDDDKKRDAEAFGQAHRLDAVMVIGDQRCAVIDGRTLFVGQSLDGFELLEVNERTAVFESNGLRVKIGIRTGSTSD